MTPIPVDALKQFFSEVTGLAAAMVVWEDEAEPAVFPPGAGDPDAVAVAFGILRVSLLGSGEDEGSDDVFYTDDPDGNRTTTTAGARTLSLSLLYESHASPQQFRAFDLLERVRTKFDAAPRWHDRLKVLTDCAVVSVGRVVRIPRVIDSRAKSTAALDLVLRMPQIDDGTVEGDGIIETVEGTGTVDPPA